MTRHGLLALLCFALSFGGACSDDDWNDIPTGDGQPSDASPMDGGVTTADASIPDAQPLLDVQFSDVAQLPDAAINPEGPDITIQTPQPNEVVTERTYEVTALITDTDGVDDETVIAIVPGGADTPMIRTGTVPDQFYGRVSLEDFPAGNLGIRVQAADTVGNVNSATVTVIRDPGPFVVFITPLDGHRYTEVVSLVFVVWDPFGVDESSVTAVIAGDVDIPVTKTAEDTANPGAPQWIRFEGQIRFDDPRFDPELRGLQWVTVSAVNIAHGTPGGGTVEFTVDNDGPSITVIQPTPGEIVGGILTIEAEVTDLAGVVSDSVVAVLSHDSNEFEVALEGAGTTYSGQFDTKALDPDRTWIFPSLTVRAEDTLGNQAEVGFLVALDNTKPILALDPPLTALYWDDTFGQACSSQFDPVGAWTGELPNGGAPQGMPNDLARTPAVFFLRARVEDRSNWAPGLQQPPLALVDQTSVKVLVLDDTSNLSLVVDTDNDGVCDAINNNVRPDSDPNTPDEALELYLVAIPPAGSWGPINQEANPSDWPAAGFPPYTRHTNSDGATCSADIATNPLADREWVFYPTVNLDCEANLTRLFNVAIHYTDNVDEPSIYTLPPVVTESLTLCSGLQFDAGANNLADGWTCIALEAKDKVGNIGISEPLRLCIDKNWDGNPVYVYGDPECYIESCGDPTSAACYTYLFNEICYDPSQPGCPARADNVACYDPECCGSAYPDPECYNPGETGCDPADRLNIGCYAPDFVAKCYDPIGTMCVPADASNVECYAEDCCDPGWPYPGCYDPTETACAPADRTNIDCYTYRFNTLCYDPGQPDCGDPDSEFCYDPGCKCRPDPNLRADANCPVPGCTDTTDPRCYYPSCGGECPPDCSGTMDAQQNVDNTQNCVFTDKQRFDASGMTKLYAP